MYKILIFVILISHTFLNALSIDEMVDKALLNNNKLKQLSLDIQQSKKSKEAIKAKNFGRFDFVASYDHYNNARTLSPLTPMEIASTPTGSYEIATTNDLYAGGISYNIILFDGFSRQNEYKISDIAHNNSMLKIKLAKEELIYNVKSLYVALLSLNEQLTSQRMNTESQTNLYKKVLQEYKLGSKSKLDILKSKNSYQESKSNEDKIQANIEILNSTLSMLIGGEEFSNISDIEIDMDKENIKQSSIDELSRFKLAQEKNKISMKKIAKAKSFYYPVVDFKAYYGYTFGKNATENKYPKTKEIIIEKDELNSEKIWQLGVHLKWNILDFGVRSSNLEKEKIALMSSRLEKNDVKLELQKNIKISKSKLKLAKADYKSAKTQYELLSEILKAQDIKYDGDAITIDDLLDSNAKVNIAYAKMISSKYEYLKVKYYIDYLYEKGEEK